MSSKDYDFRKVDNIRVIARFRPSSETERREEKIQDLHDTPPNFMSRQQVELKRTNRPEKYKCVLDHIFRSTTTQKQVYNIVGKPMVQAVLEGYNATIFAYGQTGSGKTFSMFGPEKRSNDTELGLVQRCCTYLFEKVRKRTKTNASEHDETSIRSWQLTCEFIQVYKDALSDLLQPNPNKRLQIKTNFQTDTPYVENLSSVSVNNINDLLINLASAHTNRVVASHKLNSTSSRSHMLLMITLEQQMQDGSVKRSKLNFGDLAGSEDVRKALGSNPDQERLREAIAINSSLTALTTAITMLTKKQRPSYRSSPLTHILQDSLGGNSKTTMIVAASPHIMNRSETIRTLRFAQQAKQVQNRARINKQETRAQLLKRISELEAMNAKLKTRVIELETAMSEAGLDVTISKELYDEMGAGTDSSDQDSEDDMQTSIKKQQKAAKAAITSNKSGDVTINVAKNGKEKGKKDKKGKKLIEMSADGGGTELSMETGTNVGVKSSPRKVDLQFQADVSTRSHRFSQSVSVPTLLKQIESFQKQIQKGNDEQNRMVERNQQLEIEIESITAQMTSLKEDLDGVHRTNKTLGKENKDFQERMIGLTTELEDLKNNTAKQQSDLDKQIQRQRNRLQMHLSAKTDLQKENKQLNLQNENLLNENDNLRQQLNALKRQVAQNPKQSGGKQGDQNQLHYGLSDDDLINDSDLTLNEEEKTMEPAELLLHRFADVEATDVRMTPEQRMKKTSKMMGDLSSDIGGLMGRWLPKQKVRKDRKQSKALVFQVRQLIGHFNVLHHQLEEQKESHQNDLKLDIRRRDQEIKRLKEENSKVLQYQDDLAEKDDEITALKKQILQHQQESELLRNQTQEQADMIHDVQSQVSYLNGELDRSRSTILFQQQEHQEIKKQLGLDTIQDGNESDWSDNSDDDNYYDNSNKNKLSKKK